MRTAIATNIAFCLLSALVLPSRAHSTTIVVKVERNRIILAADTRRRVLTPDSGPTTNHVFHDDICKIELLGRVVFAATGNIDYHPVIIGDTMADWNTLQDAKTVALLHNDSIPEMADDWGRRAIDHYKTFYFTNPSRVRELAGANDSHLLIEGVFAGWGDAGSNPTLIFVALTLDETKVPPITGTRYVFPSRELPYTTNGNTQDLIEKHTAHALETAKRWKKLAKKFREPERDWRWVEFLVQATADYDDTVDKDVDIVEVRPSGSSWLQNHSCSQD